jgi:saccharopine dehydrogenase-like NADP-dependent oxidoreductase
MPVMNACVTAGINMVTSSYVSPDMMKLDEHAKAKGLTLLNECGLDPGIDIMGTMKVVDEAKKRGWKVVSYESFCGGLPVAE